MKKQIKKILILLLFISTLTYGSEVEKMFWDEVKDTNDIELLKLYQKRYPNGIFESLAKIKIDRLRKANIKKIDIDAVPNWIKGHTDDYKYYGVGKALKHFKGEEYQKALALKRAKKELFEKFHANKLPETVISEYITYLETKEYKNKRDRIFILVYIDNTNID
ncbi:MAG: hypothetical protein U9Q04_06510 [Campylobacterota bacterium]|nr:hypothetical protein [Campylobacterota bacterium]